MHMLTCSRLLRTSITAIAVAIWSLQALAQAASKPPQLFELTVSRGPAGEAYPLETTIRGTGFVEKDNVVQFGPVKMTGIASSDGSHITFAVPKVMSGRGEVPPIALTAGQYDVTVANAGGTSNALTFTLTPR